MKLGPQLSTKLLLATAIVLAAAPAVLAHGGDEGAEGMDMSSGHSGSSSDMHEAKPPPSNAPSSYKPTYFAHPEHVGVIYAHIAVMTVAWVFALPVGM